MVNNMARVLDMKIAKVRGAILADLHVELFNKSIEYWIEYNYEIAQGRKQETNNSFIWLDE